MPVIIFTWKDESNNVFSSQETQFPIALGGGSLPFYTSTVDFPISLSQSGINVIFADDEVPFPISLSAA